MVVPPPAPLRMLLAANMAFAASTNVGSIS